MGVGIGAVRVWARGVDVFRADNEVGELLDHLGGRGVEDEHIVLDEEIGVVAARAAFLVLDLDRLLELVCDGKGVTGSSARGVDDDVGQGGIYWL